MEITNDELPWDSENVELFRAFLLTPTGQRLVPKLAASAPSLLSKGDTNEICIRCGEVRGFQEVIKSLLALTVIQPGPSKAEDAYPPLEDDKAWSDGEKINT